MDTGALKWKVWVEVIQKLEQTHKIMTTMMSG